MLSHVSQLEVSHHATEKLTSVASNWSNHMSNIWFGLIIQNKQAGACSQDRALIDPIQGLLFRQKCPNPTPPHQRHRPHTPASVNTNTTPGFLHEQACCTQTNTPAHPFPDVIDRHTCSMWIWSIPAEWRLFWREFLCTCPDATRPKQAVCFFLKSACQMGYKSTVVGLDKKLGASFKFILWWPGISEEIINDNTSHSC